MAKSKILYWIEWRSKGDGSQNRTARTSNLKKTQDEFKGVTESGYAARLAKGTFTPIGNGRGDITFILHETEILETNPRWEVQAKIRKRESLKEQIKKHEQKVEQLKAELAALK
jgi:hypothetical protein